MQCLGEAPRVHVDLHVGDIAAATSRSVELGATLVDDAGFSIMRSPAGFTFCIVNHDGEADRGPRICDPVEHRQDVICIDAPSQLHNIECEFWAELTRSEVSRHPKFPEYASLPLAKQGLALSMLVQALGDDDGRTQAHAHLDISAGERKAAVVAHHLGLGATVSSEFEHWSVLRDPAGLDYCITDRAPD